jgi:hypothetical protein
MKRYDELLYVIDEGGGSLKVNYNRSLTLFTISYRRVDA